MSRKVKRQKVSLDSGGVKDLSRQEIEMILRAADDLIMKGGRNMLVKTLKGSRDKKLLSHGMQDNPAYGFYRDLKLEEIGHRVDWMIRRAYLEIRYDYRLPLLVYTKEGWEIEKLTYARECYALYKKDRTRGKNRSITKLKTVNPQVALEVLRWIAEEGTEKDLAGLQAWEQEAQGQLKKRLNFAIRQISIREAGETADSADKPVRLFIAVPMEGAIRESLVRDMDQLQKAGATGTFQPPENLHGRDDSRKNPGCAGGTPVHSDPLYHDLTLEERFFRRYPLRRNPLFGRRFFHEICGRPAQCSGEQKHLL